MKGISIVTFLIICGFVPSIWANCSEKDAKSKFQRSVYEFSLDLLTRVAQEKESHFVTSTFSIWAALSCTSLGAGDKTLTELKNVLKLHKTKCFNYKYLSLASKVAINDDTDVDIQKSSSIFVDDRFSIKNEFKNRLETTNLSSIVNMTFDDAEDAAQKINDYVIRATHNTVDGVVAPGDIENAIMIIIDSIFFKGNWQKPFNRADTGIIKFYNDRGVALGDVNMMVASDMFRVGNFPQLDAQILELPYGNNTDNRYSMLVFLPDESVSIYNVINKLKEVNLRSINYVLQQFGEQFVTVQIPRFKISSDLSNLKELLIDMGLKSMFDASASFPSISNLPIYVSNFIQKANIEVIEEGTTAAAVTKVEFTLRSGSSGFYARRPFFYMIIDKKYDIPLFAGAYSKPSVY